MRTLHGIIRNGKYYRVGIDDIPSLGTFTGNRLQIMFDVEPFVDVSMGEGEIITSRRHLKEFEKRNGVVQIGDEKPTADKPEKPPVMPDILKAIEQIESRDGGKRGEITP